ncbi:MAG: L,D-transpeptidase [Defluviitaleaceae bacterium]|nr:L,D-transpeptidase [Defluviitaleaceae bacterium]
MMIFILTILMMFPSALPPILESPVFALIAQDGMVYHDKALRQPFFEVSAGEVVEILEDYSGVVYKVKKTDGSVLGWVGVKQLKIPPDSPADTSVLTAAHLENFVNEKSYTSPTDFLILTEINRQKVHIFEGAEGAWVHARSFDCSTGRNTSPTTRGIFSLTDRGPWFYSHRLTSGAKYWIRFNNHYLFHSTPMDENGVTMADEDVVGERRSNGCVRLLLPDIKWIYENIPDKTTVVIL